MMNQAISHWVFLLLLLIVAVPAVAQRSGHPLSLAEGLQETPDKVREALYKRFTDNFKTDQRVAYEAAKEYLQKYADYSPDITQYLRKWVGLYEQSALRAQAQRGMSEDTEQQPQQRTVHQPQPRTVGFVFKREPELGMALPGNPPASSYLLSIDPGMPDPYQPGGWTSTSRPTPGFEAEWFGIKGIIGADMDEWLITYVATSDVNFKTSEGLKVGDSAARVLEISKGQVIKENDYVFSVKLPSGWSAQFKQADYNTQGKLIPNIGGKLRPETKVVKFYKKLNVKAMEKETVRGTVIAESTSIGARGNTTSQLFLVHTQKQSKPKDVAEFIIVLNKYKTKRDASATTQPTQGERVIVEPHLSKTVTAQKQPIEFLLTRNESCDRSMESILYGYIGVTLPNGKRGVERMRDLSNIFDEEVKKIPLDAKLPCYVLRADEFKLLGK